MTQSTRREQFAFGFIALMAGPLSIHAGIQGQPRHHFDWRLIGLGLAGSLIWVQLLQVIIG